MNKLAKIISFEIILEKSYLDIVKERRTIID
jgi:hypothetical protein